MAKTKAELEEDHEQYSALSNAASTALQQGDAIKAVEIAVSSWPLVDGMMQFERRHLKKEVVSVFTIDVVLAHAPALLDLETLDRLDSLLKTNRRIAKNTSSNIAAQLSEARAMLRTVYAIWEHFDISDGILKSEAWRDVPCEYDAWWAAIQSMCVLGVVQPVDNGKMFRCVTSMEATTNAKCSSCGTLVKAPKHRLLDEAACPSCRKKVPFVLVADVLATTS